MQARLVQFRVSFDDSVIILCRGTLNRKYTSRRGSRRRSWPRLRHNLMVIMSSGTLNLDFHARQHPTLHLWIKDVLPDKRTVSLVELEWSDGSPHAHQIGGLQRDHVGYGPHERVRDGTGRPIDMIKGRLWRVKCQLQGKPQSVIMGDSPVVSPSYLRATASSSNAAPNFPGSARLP